VEYARIQPTVTVYMPRRAVDTATATEGASGNIADWQSKTQRGVKLKLNDIYRRDFKLELEVRDGRGFPRYGTVIVEVCRFSYH
jgi:hypothetical protein